MTEVVTSMHCKGFLETISILLSFPVFCHHLRMFTSLSRQNETLGGEENIFAIHANVCYILKHLEDTKALSAHTYYTRCDIILIFKLHRLKYSAHASFLV